MAAATPHHSYAETVWHDIRKHGYLLWHRFSCESFSFARVGFVVLKAALIISPAALWALQGGWKRGAIVVLGYCCLILLTKYTEFSPDHQPFVLQEYARRKTDFTGALMVIGDRLKELGGVTEEEKAKIRKYALNLIVSYVRGHRRDLKGSKIYATLLVEVGKDMEVVLRSSGNGEGEKHPKESLLAWRSIAERRTAWTGDVRYDFATTPVGTQYNSIMTVPIFPVNSTETNPAALAALAIVSSEPFHFDLHADELETQIMPYLKLLSITL